jgi:hypothetical protein
MAIIRAGTTTDLLTIGATSKAARATLYAPNKLLNRGTEWRPKATGLYALPISLKLTAGAAGLTIWAMRNSATAATTVHIRRIDIGLSYTTTVATTISRFSLVRFSGATPTGGTSLTVILADTTFAATAVTDARFAVAGLTTTGITFETTPMAELILPEQVASNVPFSFNMAEFEDYPFAIVLQPGEGFAIRTLATQNLGELQGSILWEER